MIPKKVLMALNEQLNFEFHSAFHYLAMETYFHGVNLPGFAHYMREQYKEERMHALKIVDYINARNCRVLLKQIAEPPSEWASPLEVFEDAHRQEQKSSGMINDLVDLALNERDHATDIFLKWFIEKQVEEEAQISSIVQKLKLVGDDAYGLFLLDRDME
ncbi:MAG: ferritin [Gemmatimonadota bacterium]|nr:ferritin [Gemmatimonadota bacterium]MDE2953024.1 ferritin [Gemmatimonadota bacterium]